MSSGVPIFSEVVAENIINGFGRGKILFKNINPNSYSFLMDNKKIKNKTGINLSKKNILDYCKQIGKKLSYA